MRCREAVEGADSTATHSHQDMMPKCVCAKKYCKTPQTPAVPVLETSQHLFSRRRKGNDSPSLSGGHRRMVTDPKEQAGTAS